jgi:N6-adenosine-specific RNA methylase IME4
MNIIEQAYGQLREGVHITGYTFERACTRLLWLLEDGRWKKCGDGFRDINTFLGSVRFDEFKLIAEQRKRLAAKIKALQPKASNRAIAKAVGAGRRTIDRDLGPNGPRREKNISKIKHGGGPNVPLSGALAAQVVARHERVKDQQETASARITRVALDARELGKFSAILADPPWDDEFGACRRSIENHYPTMTLEQICALPVNDVAHEQAVLFLWATPAMIEMALTTAAAWGFKYRTHLVWVKPSIGIGKYVRQRHELLFICRRGDHPAPDPTTLSESVIEAPRGTHSEKPERFHEIIERMYPGAEKIELFRRGPARIGWAAWGGEAQVEQAAARARFE